MTRREIRESLYIMLFRLEMYIEDLEHATGKIKKELREKFEGVIEHLEEIDSKIEEKAKGWTVNRIAKAELTILRLAVFELLYVDDVPNRVAINEAVELAKAYGGDKGPGFINGVLASIVRELPEDK